MQTRNLLTLKRTIRSKSPIFDTVSIVGVGRRMRFSFEAAVNKSWPELCGCECESRAVAARRQKSAIKTWILAIVHSKLFTQLRRKKVISLKKSYVILLGRLIVIGLRWCSRVIIHSFAGGHSSNIDSCNLRWILCRQVELCTGLTLNVVSLSHHDWTAVDEPCWSTSAAQRCPVTSRQSSDLITTALHLTSAISTTPTGHVGRYLRAVIIVEWSSWLVSVVTCEHATQSGPSVSLCTSHVVVIK